MNSILVQILLFVILLTGFTDSEREISQNAILSQQKRISNSQDDIDDDEIEDAGPGNHDFSFVSYNGVAHFLVYQFPVRKREK